jgi:DNA primase
MTDNRIDFKELKERTDFVALLARYGIKAIGSGAQRSALCPFHDDTRESLSINIERKVFHCFACDAKGDIFAFIAKLERISIREAAELIAEAHPIPLAERAVASEGRSMTDRGNKPLNFKLKLDGTHPYLAERGLSPELVDTFGLGYCSAGILQGRICIPIHNEKGNLVAYAGRWPADPVPGGERRYLLPAKFKKSHVLFNLHRVSGRSKHLVIVEGYWSVFRLHALGIAGVALMGRSLSTQQEELLVQSGVRLITLLLDGDVPGRTATANIMPRLASWCFVRAPALTDDQAPDSMAGENLMKILQFDE